MGSEIYFLLVFSIRNFLNRLWVRGGISLGFFSLMEDTLEKAKDGSELWESICVPIPIISVSPLVVFI